MCFKNLPIEFDVHGRAQLRDAAWGEPFTPRQHATPLAQRVRHAHLRDFDIDPMTRVGGALPFHTVIDLERRQAVEARTKATLFRGYEVILQGREPTDAIHIARRACGVCGAQATVRGLLDDLTEQSDTVVIDMEAGLEHLSRGTLRYVDTLLVVAEPYFKSMETAARCKPLAEDLGIPRI